MFIYGILEDGSRAVVWLTYSYGTVDVKSNKYDMLISLFISKNSTGAYQIDSHENGSDLNPNPNERRVKIVPCYYEEVRRCDSNS